MSGWTARQYAEHYIRVAEHYRDTAIFVRGDLTAWKAERQFQAATDADYNLKPGADYHRCDGAINAINHLASKAESRREKYLELALVAGYGCLDELARHRARLS